MEDGFDSRDNDNHKPRKLIGYLLPKLAFSSGNVESNNGHIPEVCLAISGIIYDFYMQDPQNKFLKGAYKDFEKNYGKYASGGSVMWYPDAGDKFFNDYNNNVLPDGIKSLKEFLKNPGEKFLERIYKIDLGIIKRKNKEHLEYILDRINSSADSESLGDKYKYKKILSNPPSAW